MFVRPGSGGAALLVFGLAACGQAALNPGGGGDAGQPIVDSGGGIDGGLPDAGPDAGEAVDSGYAAEHSAWPPIPSGTERVQNPMTLVTLVASNDSLATELFQFGDALVASQWWQTIGADYHLGTAQSVHVTGPAITADLSATEMIDYVGAAISAGAPAPNGATTYVLYLPDGVGYSDASGCRYYVSYPSFQTTLGDKLVKIRRCTPAAGETQLNQLTIDASALIADCAADPLNNSYDFGYTPAIPWDSSVWDSASSSGLIGVAYFCSGTRIAENGILYQRIWSSRAAAAGGDPCVPALSIPYYNSSSAQGWYTGVPGDQVSIPLVGWSTATLPDWFLNPHLINYSTGVNELTDGGFFVTSALGFEHFGNCGSWPATNNGEAATLYVRIPPGAHSGDFGVFSLHNFREDPGNSCSAPLDDDLDHQWLVGFYVP